MKNLFAATLVGLFSFSAFGQQQEVLRCHYDTNQMKLESFSLLLPWPTLQALEVSSSAPVPGTVLRYRSRPDGNNLVALGAYEANPVSVEVKTLKKIVLPVGFRPTQDFDLTLIEYGVTRRLKVNGVEETAVETIVAGPNPNNVGPRTFRCTRIFN